MVPAETRWDCCSNLLLAQFIYKNGDSDFERISGELGSHPFMRECRSPTPDSCERRYKELLEENNLEREPTSAAAPGVKPAKCITTLTRILHAKYYQELVDKITSNEDEFLKLNREIEEIREGKWDERFRERIVLESKTKDEDMSIQKAVEEGVNPEERIDGSMTVEVVVEPSIDLGPGESASKTQAEIPAAFSSDHEQIQPEEKASSAKHGLQRRLLRSEEAKHTEPVVSDKAVQGEEVPLSYLKSRKRSRRSEVKDSPLASKTRKTIATPAQDEGSPGTPRLEGMSPNRHRKFVGLIMTVWNDISTHRNGALFNSPVTDREAPGYSSLIKTPQDLKTIRQKVRDGVITNAKEFERDILLMFANSIMFNEEGTDMSKMAQEMRAEAEKLVQSFIQTEKRAVKSSH